MTPRTWALAGTALSGLVASTLFVRPFASTSGRIHVSIREARELPPLLLIPTKLIANFCVLAEPKGKSVSKALQTIVTNEPRFAATLGMVDIEADEPGVQELLNQYVVKELPTLIAFKGGDVIGRFIPDSENREQLELKLLQWLESLD